MEDSEEFTASILRVEEHIKQNAGRMSVKLYKMARCGNMAVCKIARWMDIFLNTITSFLSLY